MSVVMFTISALYLFLPAGLANMAPPFFKKMAFLDYPIDFGTMWKGKTLFGRHKTWRGLFFGSLMAIAIAVLQKMLFVDYPLFREISLVDYSAHSALLIGFLLGLGALLGDSIESFFKRRVGIKPGKAWIPFDQVDFVIGSLALLCIVFVPSWQTALFLLVAIPVFHITFNHIGFYLGINNSKW